MAPEQSNRLAIAYDTSIFLKFLIVEKTANPEIKLEWKTSHAKPDYWRLTQKGMAGL